jgi:hypothetical protein
MDVAVRSVFKGSIGELEVRQQVMKRILKHSKGMVMDFVELIWMPQGGLGNIGGSIWTGC